MSLTKFGRYEILEEVGQGGMAEVYQAHDPNMDRLVALKIIRKNFSQDPRFHDRFWREAKTIANLEHRAIVPVHDFGSDEPTGQLYLVMRLMPDVLNKRLQREGVFSLEETSLILNRLAAALNAAHSRGIMHRDIKPANILLDDEGTVFLADFGLAAHIEKIESGMVPASYGGSMFYMAPEQWLDKPLGQYTDVYQLGVTLFEMLTGRRPFPEADMQILLDRHVNGHIPDACEFNPMLPSKIQPILEKSMAKEPSERYQTVQELAEEVANLLRPKQIKRRYEIKEELQHGRFAVVYLAHDLVEDHRVALKIMKQPLMTNQIYRQLFRQQRQQILEMPTHEALVPVYELDLHEKRPFLVMKFVEGASLRERFRKERPLPIDKVCDIARQLAAALDALHENQQVHGDINMGNVLLDSEDNCFLTDFHSTAVAELTQAMQEQEAPLAYLPAMSPEQWAREPLVPQSDVYQFGLLLFELLCGQRPFTETSMAELQTAVEKESPPKISSLNEALPHQFDDIFAKALAKQPEARYASATALVQALEHAWQSHTFESFVYEGETSYELKQWDKAIDAYERALTIRPNNQAVVAALTRAERRKQDALVLEQTRSAIEAERWRDADYFLSQASNIPEKKVLQKQVQREIELERLYSKGKLAMQQQEWLTAQKLLDEADSLEPNYRDVNLLLGELAETIEGCLQQAREAIANSEYDRALTLLEPVAGHETAVALRQEIIERRQSQQIQSSKKSRSRRGTFGWGMVGLLGLAVAAFFIFNSSLTEEEKLTCVKTAVPLLHINHPGDVVEYVLNQGETAPIPSSWHEFNLSVEWGPTSLSTACQRFINGDISIESIWEPDGGNIQKKTRWEASYLSSPSSLDNDRIVVTLSYDGQPLTNVFLLNFQP